MHYKSQNNLKYENYFYKIDFKKSMNLLKNKLKI